MKSFLGVDLKWRSDHRWKISDLTEECLLKLCSKWVPKIVTDEYKVQKMLFWTSTDVIEIISAHNSKIDGPFFGMKKVLVPWNVDQPLHVTYIAWRSIYWEVHSIRNGAGNYHLHTAAKTMKWYFLITYSTVPTLNLWTTSPFSCIWNNGPLSTGSIPWRRTFMHALLFEYASYSRFA